MAISLVYHNSIKSNCFDDLKIALFDMTHAGQESHWFAVSDGRHLYDKNGEGTVDITNSYGNLNGFVGIGSNSSKPGAKPAISYSPKLGNFAVAFEGYIINGEKLREKYGGETDAELSARFIADANSFEKGVENIAGEIKGHYNLAVATEKGEGYGARGPLGVRSLISGNNYKGHAIVSESRALSHIDMILERDIESGEIFGIDGSGIHILKKLKSNRHICSFLWPYYQMPDCVTEGISVHLVKKRIGAFLGEEDKKSELEIDVATFVPDSGKVYEEGYAKEFGCDHAEILKKYQYAGRSYDRPGQGFRDLIAGVKLTVIPYEAKDKRIVLLDDSIRRGTQIIRPKGPINLLKQAGAKEIHLRICSPRNVKYCRFSPPEEGLYRDEELAANRFPTDEGMAGYLGVKSVRFIGLEDFVRCIIENSKLTREDLSLGCYTGDFSYLE